MGLEQARSEKAQRVDSPRGILSRWRHGFEPRCGPELGGDYGCRARRLCNLATLWPPIPNCVRPPNSPAEKASLGEIDSYLGTTARIEGGHKRMMSHSGEFVAHNGGQRVEQTLLIRR